MSFATENSVVTYTYDAANRLLSETTTTSAGGVIKTVLYTYDDNGNLLTAITTEGGASSMVAYTYNGFGQQKSAVVGNKTVSYTYNADGIRTGKAVNGIMTNYLLDGGNVVAEYANGSAATMMIRIFCAENAKNSCIAHLVVL